MKFLFYSDAHWREDRLEDLEWAHDQIGDMAVKLKVDAVINGGDTFHDKGLIKTRVFDALYRSRKKWAEDGLKNIDIIGNHDPADKAGKIHPLKVFEEFDGWHVVDSPRYIEECGFYAVPYVKDIKSHLHDKSEFDLIAHTGVLTADMGGIKDSDSVDPKCFSGYNKVFLGHYHKRQKIKPNIYYIGSPIQQTFAEADQKKGVLYYNRDRGTVQFIEIKGTRKHYEVVVSWDKGKPVYKKPEGLKKIDIVKFKISGTSEQVKSVSRDRLSKGLGCDQIKIDRKVNDDAFSRLRIEPEETDDLRSLAAKYVDFINPDLDRKKLMEALDAVTCG